MSIAGEHNGGCRARPHRIPKILTCCESPHRCRRSGETGFLVRPPPGNVFADFSCAALDGTHHAAYSACTTALWRHGALGRRTACGHHCRASAVVLCPLGAVNAGMYPRLAVALLPIHGTPASLPAFPARLPARLSGCCRSCQDRPGGRNIKPARFPPGDCAMGGAKRPQLLGEHHAPLLLP